jgi:4-hydroxybutyryl-CoA dehydratase/vinylacetyl-CoA-Delta-isomerase
MFNWYRYLTMGHLNRQRRRYLPSEYFDDVGGRRIEQQPDEAGSVSSARTCQGATCVGWTAINALWPITYELDKEFGTEYHQRIHKHFRFAEKKNCVGR